MLTGGWKYELKSNKEFPFDDTTLSIDPGRLAPLPSKYRVWARRVETSKWLYEQTKAPGTYTNTGRNSEQVIYMYILQWNEK